MSTTFRRGLIGALLALAGVVAIIYATDQKATPKVTPLALPSAPYGVPLFTPDPATPLPPELQPAYPGAPIGVEPNFDHGAPMGIEPNSDH